MKRIAYLSLCALVVVCSYVPVVYSAVTMPAIFGDNMVLQRDYPLPVWGWAGSGEKVTVKFRGKTESAIADSTGAWKVVLPAVKAGGPYELGVKGENTITFKNVMVGEVWIGSGQSNMWWKVSMSANPVHEIASACDPNLRLFTVKQTVAGLPQNDVEGQWDECSPAVAAEFSAVAYYFGRELRAALDIPIGLIHTSWGGTLAEAWTSTPALGADPDFQAILDRQKVSLDNYHKALETYQKDLQTWLQTQKQAEAKGNPIPQAPSMPGDPRLNPNQPSVLYNGMIAPLVPYAVRGAIWYQGESNAARAYQYRKLFPAMIQDWRNQWKQEEFTFLFVQLANFIQTYAPKDSWAELREAQTMTLSLPQTGMAVINDIGDPNDIHPKNKQEVGRRLALAARAISYQESIEYSGPVYESMAMQGRDIVLKFSHVDDGMMSGDGKELNGFTIAGKDKNFVPAQAKIVGDTVIVSSPDVSEPAAVRYMWADNPTGNLYNHAGLPAGPFRTDDWPGATVNER